MGYEISLALAWQEMDRLGCRSGAIPFMGQQYLVDTENRRISLCSGGDSEGSDSLGGRQAGEMQAVLILHYLIGLAEKGYHPTGQWISFKEAAGGESFWPALVESCIKPLLDRFERDPEGVVLNLEKRMSSRRIEGGDVALEIEALPGVFIRMVFWKRDEELPAGVALLFDRALLDIYCTEDVAVLLMEAAEDAG